MQRTVIQIITNCILYCSRKLVNCDFNTRKSLHISDNLGHNNNNNKWSKNFDKMPHRRLVTPRGGKWICPTLTSSKHDSLGSPTQSRKQHLDRFRCFSYVAHERDQQTHRQTNRQADQGTPRTAIGRYRHIANAAMRPKDNNIVRMWVTSSRCLSTSMFTWRSRSSTFDSVESSSIALSDSARFSGKKSNFSCCIWSTTVTSPWLRRQRLANSVMQRSDVRPSVRVCLSRLF